MSCLNVGNPMGNAIVSRMLLANGVNNAHPDSSTFHQATDVNFVNVTH
jgi:hypothetical protein